MYNLINRNDKFQTLKERLIVIYYIKIDKHLYIGSSQDFCSRLRHHRHGLINNKHVNIFLQNAYNKYKNASFGILQQFDDISSNRELFNIEGNWMKLLNSDLNLSDPLFSGGNHMTKIVYQYDLNGNFIKEWSSINIASIKLKLTRHAMYACASEEVVASKSAHGYIWSYKKLGNGFVYSNNTGSNLIKTPIIIYENNIILKEFNSIGIAAKFMKEYLNYSGSWKTLRTGLFNSVKNGWKFRNKFIAKYKTGS